jgi:hypothetical protein
LQKKKKKLILKGRPLKKTYGFKEFLGQLYTTLDSRHQVVLLTWSHGLLLSFVSPIQGLIKGMNWGSKGRSDVTSSNQTVEQESVTCLTKKKICPCQLMMTVKNTLLTMHDDELGYEIFANVFKKNSFTTIFQAFQRIAWIIWSYNNP